jgi:hypothetical protein
MTWRRRKLTTADGEHILWHVLESLQRSDDYWHNTEYLPVELAMNTVRALLRTFRKGVTP